MAQYSSRINISVSSNEAWGKLQQLILKSMRYHQK
jgi:hypothetical protein